MLLAGIQAHLGLDPRLKHSGVTTLGKAIRGPLDTPLLAAGFFIVRDLMVTHFGVTTGSAQYRRMKDSSLRSE
jgi:hypothetical protein